MNGITRREFLAGSSFAVAATTLAACNPSPISSPTASGAASSTGPSSSASAQTSAAPGSAVLRQGIFGEPTTLDVAKLVSGEDYLVGKAIFDSLVSLNEQKEIVPGLAESWDDSNPTRLVLQLRSGVKFHNGQDFTSADAKSSIERMLDPNVGTESTRAIFGDVIVSVEGPSPDQLVINLRVPHEPLLSKLPEIRISPSGTDATEPIGTGPFSLVAWNRNQNLSVTKFADYWQDGLPLLDQADFAIVPDQNQQVTQLQTGLLDVIFTPPLAAIEGLRSQFQVVTPDAEATDLYSIAVINTQRPFLSDVRVRQALSWAIDREAIAQALFGLSKPRSTFVPSTSPYFDESAPAYASRDLATAKQLLQDAGVPEGHRISIRYSGGWFGLPEILQASLLEAGINADLIAQDGNIWVEDVLNKSDFDIALTVYGALPNPDSYLSVITYGSVKAGGWSERDRFLSDLTAAAAIADANDRNAAYDALQQLVMTDCPVLPLATQPQALVATHAVTGLYLTDNGTIPYPEIGLGS